MPAEGDVRFYSENLCGGSFNQKGSGCCLSKCCSSAVLDLYNTGEFGSDVYVSNLTQYSVSHLSVAQACKHKSLRLNAL